MNDHAPAAPAQAAALAPANLARVTLWQIFRTFLVIGGTSFGGGVVAYLRNALVLKQGWLDEEGFLAALEISQALPGLNATNMSVIVGDRLRGLPGALAAFFGMVLPGSAIVMTLGIFYAQNHHNTAIVSVLKGVGAASVGLLLAVTVEIGRKQLEHALDLALVILTLVLVSIFHISLVVVLLTVGPLAIYLYRPRPAREIKAGKPGPNTPA